MPEQKANCSKRFENLIVFDGECVLCSGFFRFMLKPDRGEKFLFATAQSTLGQQLYSDLSLRTDEFETNLVIVDGVVFQKFDAFAAAMRALPGIWSAFSICRFLPDFLKIHIYNAIARNRFAILGRNEECPVPDNTLRARFAPGGF